MLKPIGRRKQHVLRKKPRMPTRVAVPDPARANLLNAYKAEFLEWGLTVGLSEHTAAIRERGIDTFIRWCDERGLNRPQDITRPILQRYQRHLFHYRKADGHPLAFTTQATLRTNSIMKTLTLVSVTLLPATLLTGITGMLIKTPVYNIGDEGFWAMLVIMAVIGGLTLVLARRKRWI